MNEYSVRLVDGRIFSAYAYTKSDIFADIEAKGMSRDNIDSIRLVKKRPADLRRYKRPRINMPLQYGGGYGA